MYALLALGVLSLLLCLLLTPLCRDVAISLNFVDVPDDVRKRHSRPIPRIGGVAIILSYSGALLLMVAIAPLRATVSIQHKDLLWSLVPAVALVFLTGLIDDIVTLKPWQKLAGQIIAAVVAVHGGARITLLDGHPHTAWLTIPLSIFWLLACTNAFNLIDGMDGLASGVGLFATLTTLLAALLQGNMGLAMATVPLAGCLLGFLRYNFNPASVFLGDCGSLTIGFLLGCFGMIWSQKSATFLGMLAPAIALALPLFDVALSIGRRFLRDKPIFQPDAGHIHHRLLEFGFHPRTVAMILYAACGLAAVLSLLQSSFGYHVGGIVVMLFCFLAFLGVKHLGYTEFQAVSRILSSSVLGLVRQEIYLATLRDDLLKVDNQTEFWAKVRDACRELEFTSVRLTLDGHVYEEVLHTIPGSRWQLSMSFGNIGDLTLGQPTNKSSQTLISSFFRVLDDCLHHEDLRTVLSRKSVHAAA
jgi:UDP-GlcNAc:undecaprenyl-phosphate GlcNAc-1-phosphate transferase